MHATFALDLNFGKWFTLICLTWNNPHDIYIVQIQELDKWQNNTLHRLMRGGLQDVFYDGTATSIHLKYSDHHSTIKLIHSRPDMTDTKVILIWHYA